MIWSKSRTGTISIRRPCIRQKPSIGSVIIRQFPQGEILEAIRLEDEWYLVKLEPDESGATSGYDAHTDLRYVFSKQLTIIGSTMGAKGRLFDLVGLLHAGRIRPVIDLPRQNPGLRVAGAGPTVHARGGGVRPVTRPAGAV